MLPIKNILCHYCCRRIPVSLAIRQISSYKPNRWTWTDRFNINSFRFWRRRLANRMANQYEPERVMVMGPDFACMEWLMNAGATSCLLSNGIAIGNRREMRQFLGDQGFDLDRLKMEAPKTQVIKEENFNSEKQFQSSLNSDMAYNERWPHISPIHLKEVDAADAVITDRGFKYFLECRDLEKLKLNFNDYFGDDALQELSQGRPLKTLKDLEVCFNAKVTDRLAFTLVKFTALRRLHMYCLPRVAKRKAVLRHLKTALPRCRVTFPDLYFVGMGYETEEEKLIFEKYNNDTSGWFERWLNTQEWHPWQRMWEARNKRKK